MIVPPTGPVPVTSLPLQRNVLGMVGVLPVEGAADLEVEVPVAEDRAAVVMRRPALEHRDGREPIAGQGGAPFERPGVGIEGAVGGRAGVGAAAPPSRRRGEPLMAAATARANFMRRRILAAPDVGKRRDVDPKTVL